MNHSFRVVWNSISNTWQAVAETAKGRGKSTQSSAALGAIAVSLLLAPAAWSGTLPTGGAVVAGQGTITQNGSAMLVNQTSDKLGLNWQSFSIGQGNTVTFQQPSANSVALNTVLGSDVSLIQGALRANGQVFLVNPNGVVFSPTAQLNVGSLVASTLKISTADFLAGNYTFAGDSSNAVVNQGNITAVGDGNKGGAVALIAAQVVNDGSITANRGSALMGAGSNITLDLGGPVKLQVNQGALDALVTNGGAIQADGGLVYLTAQAVNALASATINNTGVIRAQTLATGEKGEIRLMADMQHGTVNVGGTLDASAPQGGDGGFVETSGHTVNVADSTRVNTLAPNGTTGSWVIDPDVLLIIPTGGVSPISSLPSTGTSQISVGTLTTALQASNVNLQANEYIDLQTPLAYSGARTATLGFYSKVVQLGADISSSAAPLSLNFGGLYSGTTYSGHVYLYGGARTISTNGGDVVFNGNLGGSQNFTINTRGASSSGKITHNVVVNGTFTAATSAVGTVSVTAKGFNSGWISFDFVNGLVNKYTGGAVTGGLYVGGTLFNGTYAAQTFPITLMAPNGGSQLTGGASIPAGTVLGLNGTAGQVLNVYFTDGKPMLATTLDAGGGGNANYTVPVGGLQNVARIEYMGANSSSSAYTFPNITYHTLGVAGPIQNYVALADSVGGQVTLNQALNVAGSIDISAKQFINNVSGTALQAGTGKVWHVWSTDSTPYDATNGDQMGNLAYTFKQYGASYGSTTPAEAGNGYLLSLAPTVTLQIATAQSKTYDGTTNATLAAGAFGIQGGAVGGDNVNLVAANLPTSGAYNSKDVATATTVSATVGGSAITATKLVGSSTVKVYGYGVNTTASGLGSITPATARLSAVKTYDTNADFSSSQITVAGITGETLTLSGTGPATANSVNVIDNPTNYLTSMGGLALANGSGLASNYALPSLTSRSVYNTARINPYGVTILDMTGSKVYDGGITFDASQLSLSGSPVNVSLSGSATVASKNVGTYTQWSSSSLSLSGTGASNYSLVDGGVSVTITPALLTLTARTNTKAYDGTTVAAATPIVSGLQNGDSVTGQAQTYDNQNAGTGKTLTVSAYTVNDGNNGANYTVTTVADTTGVINKAALGVDVSGTYNGTTSYTSSNSTITTNGLVNGETLTGVTLHDANVYSNGSNYVTAFTAGTASLDNYSISASTNTTMSGSNITTAHNNATLASAPLGVAVSGTYNGTNVLSTAGGATITGYGLVGQDSGQTLSTATLDSKNVASATKVVALTGTGTFDQRNYVLDGSMNATGGTGTAGSAADGSGATNTATLAKAALGVDVTGTYNGTTSYTSSNATITTNGLVGGDTLTGVMVNSPNVYANGGNYISAFTAGTASLDNYAINASTNTTMSGSNITTAHNNATLARAPLGVAVSGTYNGTNVMSTAGGATITGYGLVGQDSGQTLSTATLDSKNVASATKVVSLTGTGTFDQRNYVLDGSMNATGGTGTAGGATDGSGATNTATLAKAALGVDVSGTYNGTTNYTSSNATITTNGLVGGDTLTGVVLHDANVVSNGGNYISAFTAGTASLDNYAISASTNTTMSGSNITTAHNNATLARAPLGVTVSGVSNGTNVLSKANGATITGYGLVGQDAAQTLSTATLDSANAASATKVVALTGTGTFDQRNYVLDGAMNATGGTGTAGNAADGSGATNTVRLTALANPPASPIVVPAFPDNAIEVLPNATAPTTFGGLNYVAATASGLGSLAAAPGATGGTSGAGTQLANAPLGANGAQQSPAGASTLTFVQAGGAQGSAVGAGAPSGAAAGTGTAVAGGGASGSTGSATSGAAGTATTNSAAAGGTGASTAAAAGDTAASSGSSATGSASGTAGSGTGTASAANERSDERAPAAGAEQGTTGASTLNFVAGAADGNTAGSNVGSAGGTSNTAATADAGKRKTTSELNVNNVTVPSSAGPLDVFVVDTGVNLRGIATLRAVNN